MIYLDLCQRAERSAEPKGDSSCSGAFGTILTGLEKRLGELEIKGRIEIIQTTALLRSARIFRKLLQRFAVIQISVKNSPRVKIIV